MAHSSCTAFAFFFPIDMPLGRAVVEAHSDPVKNRFPRRFFEIILVAFVMVMIDPGPRCHRGQCEASAHALPVFINRALHAQVVPGMRVAVTGNQRGSDEALLTCRLGFGSLRTDMAPQSQWPFRPPFVPIRAVHIPVEGDRRIPVEFPKELADTPAVSNDYEFIRVDEAGPFKAADAPQNAILFGGGGNRYVRPVIEEGRHATRYPRSENLTISIFAQLFIEEEMIDTSGKVKFNKFVQIECFIANAAAQRDAPAGSCVLRRFDYFPAVFTAIRVAEALGKIEAASHQPTQSGSSRAL